ncbi:MAG: dTDP-4-dehydrorhamnose reductase [Alphaproteobacteria bacterium]|nr:dTDP-4-dehydrorhamnose reductase [Alphaproteobacteria bacterium]
MFLVTGANGQLGTALQSLLKDKAVYIDRETLDLTDETKVKDYLRANKFEFIINCAAYTAVDKAEADEENARKVNALAPLYLAKYGKNIIHISTDYVFDGTNNKPYNEEDVTHPVSVYGKTKREGELNVLENAKTAIIIRTAWLYSPHGGNFVKTMRKLGNQKESLNVVFDQVGTPTNAYDLAEAIVQALPQIKSGEKEIYHFTNEGVCSWYDFALEIMAQSKLSCKVYPIESKAYPTPAHRPHYSVLNKAKIKQRFNLEIPHWKEGLIKCLKQF